MITSAWSPLRYHQEQSRLWRTRARFVAAACGRGSGKTELARRRVVRFLPLRKEHGEPPMYFYALPTRDQARRVAWDKLKALVPDNWVVGSPRESDMVIKTVFGSSLHLVGMDKPQRVEGNQWDGGIMDESCDQKPGSFDRSVRPALSHRDGWCWRIGVPKRFGPGAGDFRLAWNQYHSGDLGPGYEAYTWPSQDILSEAEILDVARSLDQRDFDEQYGAVWQGTSGLIFYAFDPVLNVRREVKYLRHLPIAVGSDFNVDPMAWVLCHYVKNEWHVFDEVWLRNTNTQAALDWLAKKYGDHDNGWVFFGDATGKSRKTSASETDYAQIKNDKRFKRSKVWYPPSNPARVARFAACNAQFCSKSGDRRVFVAPQCKHLIHDLETRAYEPGTREADDSGDIGHITDALGYILHMVNPVVATSSSVPWIGSN